MPIIGRTLTEGELVYGKIQSEGGSGSSIAKNIIISAVAGEDIAANDPVGLDINGNLKKIGSISHLITNADGGEITYKKAIFDKMEYYKTDTTYLDYLEIQTVNHGLKKYLLHVISDFYNGGLSIFELDNNDYVVKEYKTNVPSLSSDSINEVCGSDFVDNNLFIVSSTRTDNDVMISQIIFNENKLDDLYNGAFRENKTIGVYAGTCFNKALGFQVFKLNDDKFIAVYTIQDKYNSKSYLNIYDITNETLINKIELQTTNYKNISYSTFKATFDGSNITFYMVGTDNYKKIVYFTLTYNVNDNTYVIDNEILIADFTSTSITTLNLKIDFNDTFDKLFINHTFYDDMAVYNMLIIYDLINKTDIFGDWLETIDDYESITNPNVNYTKNNYFMYVPNSNKLGFIIYNRLKKQATYITFLLDANYNISKGYVTKFKTNGIKKGLIHLVGGEIFKDSFVCISDEGIFHFHGKHYEIVKNLVGVALNDISAGSAGNVIISGMMTYPGAVKGATYVLNGNQIELLNNDNKQNIIIGYGIDNNTLLISIDFIRNFELKERSIVYAKNQIPNYIILDKQLYNREHNVFLDVINTLIPVIGTNNLQKAMVFNLNSYDNLVDISIIGKYDTTIKKIDTETTIY